MLSQDGCFSAFYLHWKCFVERLRSSNICGWFHFSLHKVKCFQCIVLYCQSIQVRLDFFVICSQWLHFQVIWPDPDCVSVISAYRIYLNVLFGYHCLLCRRVDVFVMQSRLFLCCLLANFSLRTNSSCECMCALLYSILTWINFFFLVCSNCWFGSWSSLASCFILSPCCCCWTCSLGVIDFACQKRRSDTTLCNGLDPHHEKPAAVLWSQAVVWTTIFNESLSRAPFGSRQPATDLPLSSCYRTPLRHLQYVRKQPGESIF